MRITTTNSSLVTRLLLGVGLIALAGCASNGSFSGKILDGRSGAPQADIKVTARATSGTSSSCQAMEATTGADGSFSFPATCPSHAYQLESSDKTLALEGDLAFNGGEIIPGSRDLKAWRAPAEKGVYLMSGGELTEIKTAAEILKETIGATTEEVSYPSQLPSSPKIVSSEAYLALAGKDAVDTLQFHPLYTQSGATVFNKPDGITATITDASFVGAKIKNQPVTVPEDIERVEVTLDESKTHTVTVGKMRVKFIFADALPAGQYAVFAPGNRRMYVVNFDSAATAAPAAEAAPAEGAAPEAAPAEGAAPEAAPAEGAK